MTVTMSLTPTAEAERTSALSRWRPKDVARSGWWPVALLFALTAAVLDYYGVSPATTAIFTAYVALALTLPGLLLWRAAHRGSRWLVEDVAAGTAVGYAIEVLTYLPARAIGAPLLVLAPPVLVIASFLAVPSLRRYWRGPGPSQRAPVLWSWSMATIAGLLLLWSSAKFFRLHGLTWPYSASPDNDMPFHLAILGEVKHHMPPAIPFVQGEPLYYHWFVYAEMAATSWVTGIEVQTLLYRLSLLPMIAGFVLSIVAIARRLTGGWWTGPAAVAVTFFILAPNPYGWSLPPSFIHYYGFGVADDGSLLRPVLWASPTQTFGALLFAPLVLLLVDLFRGEGRDLRRWALVGLLLVGVMGAKATYLPLLLAALLLVVAVRLLIHRRLHGPALVATGITVPCLLFVQFVLFGGAAQGLRFEPFSTMKVWAVSSATGLGTSPHPQPWRLLLLTALFVLCWICIWGGVAGLGRRVVEPEIVFLIGLGIGGMGAITLLGHSGLSQGFFFQSGRPYLALAAVAGVAKLVPHMTRRIGLVLLAAVGFGGLILIFVRTLGSGRAPSLRSGALHVAAALLWPYLLLAALVAGACFALLATRRHLSKGLAAALTIAMLAGAGLTTAYTRFNYTIRTAFADGWQSSKIESWSMTEGGQEAGRWLRDHSAPDDLIATNAHCRMPDELTCDNSHVWISGYSERRVLVEGWAFTNTVHVKALEAGIPEAEVPFWRADALADNDAAFTTPSLETVSKLRDKYHVRWLFVDESRNMPSPDLGSFAAKRFRSGRCAVYEINR